MVGHQDVRGKGAYWSVAATCPATTPQTDRLNTAVDGRYRMVRHLGEGGMATVERCEDLTHDRHVALRPDLAAIPCDVGVLPFAPTPSAIQDHRSLATFPPSTSPLARLTAALRDRYRLDRELGAGGMATVFLAHDLRHERDAAIKVLHPDLGAALGGERFLSEIRITARLQHPHILPLLDSGEADGLLYYVMPLVTGETLRTRLERERQLPIADAVRIAREVASALDYAHRQNVIHRDIKPENILLHDGSALVADFGIALAVQSAGGQRLTQTGRSLGTPQYMSPEQAMGERTIDARSDVYALGAVTYEMLTGEPPFTGASMQAVVAKVISAEPERPSLTRKAVPPAIETAVLRAPFCPRRGDLCGGSGRDAVARIPLRWHAGRASDAHRSRPGDCPRGAGGDAAVESLGRRAHPGRPTGEQSARGLALPH